MTLNKKQLIHPIFFLLFLTAPILGLIFNYHFDWSDKMIVLYFIFFFCEITHSIKLKGNEIIDGIHIYPFGFIKIKKRMFLNDINELIIYKNNKKYSEIRAISSTDFLIIKTIANKIPAEEELEQIKSKIQGSSR